MIPLIHPKTILYRTDLVFQVIGKKLKLSYRMPNKETAFVNLCSNTNIYTLYFKLKFSLKYPLFLSSPSLQKKIYIYIYTYIINLCEDGTITENVMVFIVDASGSMWYTFKTSDGKTYTRI